MPSRIGVQKLRASLISWTQRLQSNEAVVPADLRTGCVAQSPGRWDLYVDWAPNIEGFEVAEHFSLPDSVHSGVICGLFSEVQIRARSGIPQAFQVELSVLDGIRLQVQVDPKSSFSTVALCLRNSTRLLVTSRLQLSFIFS